MRQEVDVVSIRLVREPPLYSEKQIRNAKDVLEVLKEELATYDREIMGILAMKTNGQPIHFYVASVGSLDFALIHPREIFKSAILANAASMILIHNHPSGSLVPSDDDKRITQRLTPCGELLGIKILDHIIISGGTGQFFSFQENGLLEKGNLQSDLAKEKILRPAKKRGIRL